MGKQIRFFQTTESEKEMVCFLLGIGLNIYPEFPGESFDGTAKRLTTPENINSIKSRLWMLSPPELYDATRPLERLCDNPIPAIEYSLCHRNIVASNSMDYARFWLDSELYNCQPLKAYYNKLVYYVKKNYLYCPELATYICKGTYERWKNGQCVLCLGTSVLEYERFGTVKSIR